MGSEADLRAASLNRPRNPTTDPVIRWNRRRGSRAFPIELVEKHDPAVMEVCREASDRGRWVRNELQDIASDNSVEQSVEYHRRRVAMPERDIRQRGCFDALFCGFDCSRRGVCADYFPLRSN
jgi:hypothetical protein